MAAKIALSDLTDLARHALERAGASPAMASTTAKALVAAEAQGLASHGVGRVPQYAAHIRLGRVDGNAVARVVRAKGGAVLIDVAEMLKDAGVRLPGVRRKAALADKAAIEGVEVPEGLIGELRALAGEDPRR